MAQQNHHHRPFTSSFYLHAILLLLTTTILLLPLASAAALLPTLSTPTTTLDTGVPFNATLPGSFNNNTSLQRRNEILYPFALDCQALKRQHEQQGWRSCYVGFQYEFNQALGRGMLAMGADAYTVSVWSPDCQFMARRDPPIYQPHISIWVFGPLPLSWSVEIAINAAGKDTSFRSVAFGSYGPEKRDGMEWSNLVAEGGKQYRYGMWPFSCS